MASPYRTPLNSMIYLKRAYDEPEPADGRRFLVDHLWPRGVKKEELLLVNWFKNAAPSGEEDITLVYGAHDTEHNNAGVLKAYLEEQLTL